MRKNGEATALLDAIMKAAPKLPLRIKEARSFDGYLRSELPVQNVYPADDEGGDEGVVQAREYGDSIGTTFSWANYIALAGNALPALLEVVSAALESTDAKVRAKAEVASRELVKVVQKIADESVVEVPESEGGDSGW